MYKLYKISCTYTASVYYGYCKAELNPIETFVRHANLRTEGQSGDSRLIQENNNDVESLQAEILDEIDHEIDAFIARNDQRALDPLSITGPTYWPTQVHQRAQKEQPTKYIQWKALGKAKNAKTARDAYSLGAFKFAQIKQLGYLFEEQVGADLDSLSPVEFSKKYDIKFEMTVV
jgi:hypothetical protein